MDRIEFYDPDEMSYPHRKAYEMSLGASIFGILLILVPMIAFTIIFFGESGALSTIERFF